MNNFYALIISYNPNISRLESNAVRLKEQGFKIMVVDNGSINPPISVLKPEEIILLGENTGIAKALNIGMEKALQRGAEWILSLDQDTEVAANLLSEYLKYINLPEIGALCPRIIRKNEKEISHTEGYEIIDRCPTAGFFVKAKVWQLTKKYDEWMFIDYVDYDICMKINIMGYKIYRIYSTYIIQELGNMHINPVIYKIGEAMHLRKMMNFARVYNHSPLRNYYFVRNSHYYIRKYREYIDVNAERNHIFRWEIKKIILEPRKIENIKAIIKGIKDYKIKIKEGETNYERR